jgi:alkyldihydroxyacetonephosphate synthase
VASVDRRRAPTPPIAFGRPLVEVRDRLGGRPIAVSDDFVARLREVCPDVDTDLGARLEAGRDWWPGSVRWALDGEVPARAGVVAHPVSAESVAAVLALSDSARVPVTPSAGRSGVSGGAVPVFGGVVLDMTALAGIIGVDDQSLLVTARPGTFGDEFETTLRGDHGLTVGHWPQSMNLSTVGGWVACRGAGQYSTRYGKIEDMVAGLQVARADGRLLRTGGRAPRSATGPDLTQVFLGSEGTLGVITEVTLRAHPVPAAERRAAYGFASFASGLDACRRILRRGATPAVLRLYDGHESRSSFGVDDACVLIVLDEGDAAVIDAAMAVVASECDPAVVLDPALVQHWWERRQDVSALEAAVRAGLTVDTIEVAASWSVLPGLYRDVIAGVQAIEGTLIVSGHQSHTYPNGGCLYFTFAGLPGAGATAAVAEAGSGLGDRSASGRDNESPGDSYYRRVWDLVMALTIARGATISHHHGIGLNRGRFLPEALGPAFDVLVALKTTLDPNGILNPGKLGLPSPFGQVPWP